MKAASGDAATASEWLESQEGLKHCIGLEFSPRRSCRSRISRRVETTSSFRCGGGSTPGSRISRRVETYMTAAVAAAGLVDA